LISINSEVEVANDSMVFGTPGEPGLKGCCGPGELRCGCGSLLARMVAGAVELKCRRCKRTWRIPIESA
jgi:hypothetical protein